MKLKAVKVKNDIERFTIGKDITLQKVEGIVDITLHVKRECPSLLKNLDSIKHQKRNFFTNSR